MSLKKQNNPNKLNAGKIVILQILIFAITSGIFFSLNINPMGIVFAALAGLSVLFSPILYDIYED